MAWVWFLASAPLPFLSLGPSPSEGNWLTTIHHLRVHRAWRSQVEHSLLKVLESGFADEQTRGDQSVVRIRRVWCCAALSDPAPNDHAAVRNLTCRKTFP